jgi:hypothetical protein
LKLIGETERERQKHRVEDVERDEEVCIREESNRLREKDKELEM